MKKKMPFILKLPIEQMKPATTTDSLKMTETKHGLHFKILESHQENGVACIDEVELISGSILNNCTIPTQGTIIAYQTL